MLLHYQMRAGTQTLIQALQAIPWAGEQDDDEEGMHQDTTLDEAESDEDDKPGLSCSPNGDMQD